MLLSELEYARPTSVDEAVELLAGHDNARAPAGGQTLLNVMKLRFAVPDLVVDLNGIDSLRGISTTDDGAIELGAMTTYDEIEQSVEPSLIRPALGQVASAIADQQVRNLGTIGGNICASDPTNHYPPLMVALGATMTIAGANGERIVTSDEFFVGVYETAVQQGEVLTRIAIPPIEDVRIAVGCVAAQRLCVPQSSSRLSRAPTRPKPKYGLLSRVLAHRLIRLPTSMQAGTTGVTWPK